MADPASQERTRAILREIVNACANELAANHPESELETSDDEDVAVENEQMQEMIEEIPAGIEEEQEQQPTSRKRKIEDAIQSLEATYLEMETKKLQFRKIVDDLANARHRERMEFQQNMCKLLADTISEAVTRCLEPRGA